MLSEHDKQRMYEEEFERARIQAQFAKMVKAEQNKHKQGDGRGCLVAVIAVIVFFCIIGTCNNSNGDDKTTNSSFAPATANSATQSNKEEDYKIKVATYLAAFKASNEKFLELNDQATRYPSVMNSASWRADTKKNLEDLRFCGESLRDMESIDGWAEISQLLNKAGENMLQFIDKYKSGIATFDEATLREALSYEKEYGKQLEDAMHLIDARKAFPAKQ